jgi:adenylate cyclase
VTTQGGEILKFMGDGMLAMFPAAAVDARAAAAMRALEAVHAARSAIAAMNATRSADGRPAVRFGLALHFGEVMFGNIGASARLDFTVIGPAVNHAARLEKLSSAIDQPVIVSADLAGLLPAEQLVPLGRHPLRDIDEPQAVYGLARGA